MDEIPTISKETIEAHIKKVEQSKEDGTYQYFSDEIIKNVSEENNEYFMTVIIPCLKSDKPEDYKKGYLAGIATLYDLLKRQCGK